MAVDASDSRRAITFGFAAPQVFQGAVDVDLIRRVAVAVEDAGFADLWVSDSTSGAPSLDPLTLLPFLAAVTSRVRLGVSVLVLPVHHPLHLAKRIVAIDALSAGRLTVGVGMGAGWDPAYGTSLERRLDLFRDVLGATDALLQHEPADYDGAIYPLHGTPLGLRPVQRPRPPIWFGVSADVAIRRAARQADGWMGSGGSDAANFERSVPVLRDELERAGRDPAGFPISKRVYFAIDDPARAAQRLGRAGGTVVWRTGDECVEYLDRLIQAGATHLLLNPAYDFAEQLEAVLPHVRKLATAKT